jgi:hypothetical protein
MGKRRMASENAPLDPYESIRYIAARYNYEDSDNSALHLILTLRPEWRGSKDAIEFVRFTDGITNTVRPHGTGPRESKTKGGFANVMRIAPQGDQQAARPFPGADRQRGGAAAGVRKRHRSLDRPQE